jgi:hypothetical protein
MKKLLIQLWKGIISFLTTEDIILLIAYMGLLFCLVFGFGMLYTLWEVLIM